MSSTKQLTIGVIGHRKIAQGQSANIKRLIKKAIENIIFYTENNGRNFSEILFITSLAEGADRLFAEVVIENFEGKLNIILPFEKEEYKKDFSTVASKNQFEYLLSHEKVNEVTELNNHTKNRRDTLYFEAGKKVVDDSDYVIAIWNEEKAKGIGGTGDSAGYAVEIKKDILVINPDDKELKINGNYLPESARKNYKVVPKAESKNIIEELFIYHDEIANQNQKCYRDIWKKCYTLGSVTAFIFSIIIAISEYETLRVLTLILKIIAFACVLYIGHLVLFEKKNSYHRKYLRHRYIAERLRIEKVFFECGFQQKRFEDKAIYTSVADLESIPPLLNINKLIQLCVYSTGSVVQKKLRTQKLIDEQIEYHDNKIKNFLSIMKKESIATERLFLIFKILLIADIIFDILKITNIPGVEFLHNPYLISALTFFSLFVPTLMARIEAKKYLNEWEKLISQSGYMISYFKKISAGIKEVKDDKGLEEILNKLNENMFIENLEWEMFMYTKNKIVQ